jgi:hypothetical protein
MAASAAPDGYTIAQIPITVFRLPAIQKTNYDPAKDFTYIIQVTGYTFGVVVRADAPLKTFNELLDYARPIPARSTTARRRRHEPAHHHGADRQAEGHQVDAGAVQGQADSMTALLGGHIDATANSTGWAERVNAGKFALLVTWGASAPRTGRRADAEGDRHQHGVELAVRHRRAEGHGPGGGEGAARCLQERHGGAVLQDTMAKLDMEPYYLGTADYHAYAEEADRRAEAARRGAGAEQQ